MRWLKHLTAAHRDERIAAYLNDTGLEGYGFYWLVLEIIGEQMTKGSTKCEVRLPLREWARRTGSHHHKAMRLLIVMQLHQLAKVEIIHGAALQLEGPKAEATPPLPHRYPLARQQGTGGVQFGTPPITPNLLVGVKIPKLLKYRDEYSQHLGSLSVDGAEILSEVSVSETERERERESEEDCTAVKKLLPPKQVNRKEILEAADRCMAFLNEATGRHYRMYEQDVLRGVKRLSAGAERCVARLCSGITEEQIRQIIAMKRREWGKDSIYLRPKTLFGRENMENYVGQLAQVEASGKGGA